MRSSFVSIRSPFSLSLKTEHFFHHFCMSSLTGPSSVTLAQLERDRSNSGAKRSFELPRDEEGHYLCIYQSCDAPLRVGESEATYFQHLEQHDRDGLRLLSTMISFASIAPSFTVGQRRAQLASAAAAGVEPPSVSDLLRNATQRTPAVWTSTATATTNSTAAVPAAAAASAIAQHGADASGDGDKAATGTAKVDRRPDVTMHGYNFPILSTLSEGARLQIKCPIEDCPKIIQGFLYHVHAHLMAHRRAAAKGEALVIRKDRQLDVKASKRAAAALAAANGRPISDDDGDGGDDDDEQDGGGSGGAGADAGAPPPAAAANNLVQRGGSRDDMLDVDDGGGGESNDSGLGGVEPAAKSVARRRKLSQMRGEDDEGGDDNDDDNDHNDGHDEEDDDDDEYGEVRRKRKSNGGAAAAGAVAKKEPRELIFCDDPRWLPLSGKANMMRDFVARYGAGYFRQTLQGEFVCFFANCGAIMQQNFPRHLARHVRDGDQVDEQMQTLAEAFHENRGTRAMD
jgi:hypothetical protein